MKIILLDRNAISYIRDWDWGTTGPNLSRYIRLRRLDRRTHVISPLFSLWEGQSGRKESTEEKRHSIEKDYAVVKRFFYRARTDTGFIKENLEDLPSILAQGLEGDFAKYEKIIEKVQTDLYQPLSRKMALEYEKALIGFVDEIDVQRSHPVVVLSIALLHGSDAARKVIKPKKNIRDAEKAAYNATVDIMTFSRLSLLYSLDASKEAAGILRFEFFTFDEGLAELSKLMKIDATMSQALGSTSYSTTVNVPHALFPRLTDGEFERIQELLTPVGA